MRRGREIDPLEGRFLSDLASRECAVARGAREWRASKATINLGILARVSAFITNRLFAPPGHRWAGKLLGGPKPAGANIFAPRREGDTNARGGLPSTWCKRRGFGATIGPSRLDGRPCLVLDYSHKEHGDSLVWGGVMRMRDELREVAPGMLLGLGSMKATGGARNCAPFVLVRVADAPAVEPIVEPASD